MIYLILSDIHGNQSALRAVLDKVATEYDIAACILLGDLIDYGMHSNEVIQMLRQLPYPIICDIRGNHEDAVLREDYSHFSSDRGRECARYTRSILTAASWEHISHEMFPGGQKEFVLGGKRCLAVHGSLEDVYWKSIRLEDPLSGYEGYDYVFSGHSHLPYMAERFYPCKDPKRRNKKKTIFINPGSVGQPRNLDNRAQYAVLDMEEGKVIFEKVTYAIDKEQTAYHGQVDDFYRERLRWGV